MHRPPIRTSTLQIRDLCLGEQFWSPASAELRSSNTDSKDPLRFGRQRENDQDADVETNGKDPTLTIEELANDCDYGHATL
ncbi:hypothetical protein KIN20_008740 [Parelaphostrongylus tenuis]|uniref:Uncharacterized protein n=1 Tax=Parelaphostrongylus tenuis TaxID=148309 RepID=A0AAD5M579_PARTN|nr:hypothetical protein KIN20_008740 [Parelaphostrongylus tenuis]